MDSEYRLENLQQYPDKLEQIREGEKRQVEIVPQRWREVEETGKSAA